MLSIQNTICRIEAVCQLKQWLLQQQGARAKIEPLGEPKEAPPATNEQSSAVGAPNQNRPQDASAEVCQQSQHDYTVEDEELDPMGWGFSIDQP